MIEALHLPFMQRALAGGILVGLLCGYFGPFIVQRRLAFLGSGLAHAAFGGVALGLWLGMAPLAVAAPFVLCMAFLIVWIGDRTALAEDTVIGVLFSVSMAFGIVLLTRIQGYAGDAFAFLFGSILAISDTDLIAALAVLVLATGTLPLWSRWTYGTFDMNMARADRAVTPLLDYALAGCIAIVIVVSIKLVGMVLLAAFLVMPAAAARLVAQRFLVMSLLSVAFAVFSAIAGLALAYHLDLPSGPGVVLIQAVIFAGAAILRRRVS